MQAEVKPSLCICSLHSINSQPKACIKIHIVTANSPGENNGSGISTIPVITNARASAFLA
jgi:hypothetical protein